VFVLDTNRKGAIAEAEIAAAAVRLGFAVFKPVSEHGRSDLVLGIGGRLWRVQCKWGAFDASRGVIKVVVGGRRTTPSGYVCSTYSEDEIDLLAVYCAGLDRCYLLPVALVAGKSYIQLRVDPPRNGQRACITLAQEVEFAGAVAQLGERLSGTQEATGSSPVSSTQPPSGSMVIGAHEFRERFGYWMDEAADGRDVLVTRHGRPRLRLSPVAPTLAASLNGDKASS
jgi:prevent-host-death family protein